MHRPTLKPAIMSYIEARPHEWHFGGAVEGYIRESGQSKWETTGRRLRELVLEGKLEKRLVKVPGVFNKVVQYKLKPKPVPVWAGEERVLQTRMFQV